MDAGPVEFEQAVRQRRSIRLFHPDKPVPRELVIESLELATRAPSNSNTQPWKLILASGEVQKRLVSNLMAQARTRDPDIAPLPACFDQVVFDLGAQLYGSLGIARDDVAGRRRARLANYRFYDAPLAGHRLHASGPGPCRQPRSRDVPSNVPVGANRTGTGELRSNGDRRFS
jgi:nitroreductase